jgi:hypothetical protein
VSEYLHTGRVRKRRTHGAVPTPHAVDVVEVERRGGHPDQQLAGFRNRYPYLLELQDLLRFSELVHAPRPHGQTLLHDPPMGRGCPTLDVEPEPAPGPRSARRRHRRLSEPTQRAPSSFVDPRPNLAHNART